MVHTKSPRITHLSWGNVEIEIDGRRHRFKEMDRIQPQLLTCIFEGC